MQVDPSPAGGPRVAGPAEFAPSLALVLALTATLAGCAVPASAPQSVGQAPAPVPMAHAMVTPDHPPPAAPVQALAPPATLAAASLPPSETALAYADRVRALPPAELAHEIQRLGTGSYAPLPATQLALALAQSRSAGNIARAQSLLQRVQQDPQGAALHPIARLLAAQLAEQRRLDEQAERQGQQLREAQRRIEQLNERLEAVRAIERSLPTRPRSEAPAPTPRPAR